MIPGDGRTHCVHWWALWKLESHPRGWTVGFHFLKSHTKGLLLLFLHPQCLWFSAGRVSHRFLPHLPFLEIPVTVPEQMVLTPLLSPHKPRGHHLRPPGSHSDPDFLTEFYVQDLRFPLTSMHRHADPCLKHNRQSASLIPMSIHGLLNKRLGYLST